MKTAIRLLCAIGLLLGFDASQAATVRTIAGYLSGYVDGDNSVSQFGFPTGLAIDSQGFVYVADSNINQIRVIDPTREVVSTFATSITPASRALYLNGPVSLAFDNTGALYVANYKGQSITKFNAAGTGASLFAPTHVVGTTTNITLALTNPVAITIDNSGNLYVAQESGEIRRYPLSSPTGSPDRIYTVTNTIRPLLAGIAITRDGKLVVSDATNHVIWGFSLVGGPATVIAGTLAGAGATNRSGFADGGVGIGKFNSPRNLAISTNGLIIVADRLNHRVRAVDSSGVITTLFGTNVWRNPVTPGWTDTTNSLSSVESYQPFGVATDNDGNLFDSELGYYIVRQATGFAYPTNSIGSTNVSNGTIGLNQISLGFEGGEASSEFKGAPGQHFISPVTLLVAPGQKMYGMQFSLNVSNLNNPAVSPTFDFRPSFGSMLLQPSLNAGEYLPILPALFVSNRLEIDRILAGTRFIYVTNYIPVLKPLVFFGNDNVGVGWLERYRQTNLYNTFSQDLITFSAAHDTLFSSQNGRVIIGGFGVTIPLVTNGSKFKLSIERPSANGDGISTDVIIETPVDLTSTATISSVRTLEVTNKSYLVGDVTPFRWFNAGDFGDGSILNNDLEQIHQSLNAIPFANRFVVTNGITYYLQLGYNINVPPQESDMFDAMDSCCLMADGTPRVDTGAGTFTDPGGHLQSENDVINSIALGDGVLDLADIYVTFRRSLDARLSNYVRQWTITGKVATPVMTNVFRPVASNSFPVVAKKKPQLNVASAQEPRGARFEAANIEGRPGEIVHLPVNVRITGVVPARSLVLRVSVARVDLPDQPISSVSFTPNSGIGAPATGGPITNGVYATWFEQLDLPSGTHQLGTVDVAVPANANADCLFRVKIEHAEAAAGLIRFPVTSQNGYIVMQNRAALPWSDAIPDEWRVHYFGSLMDVLSAPDADADGDGVNNLDEYRAGTDPRDILSRFTVRGRTTEAGATYILSWPTVSGKYYRLESSDALRGGAWSLVEDRIPGTGSLVQRLRYTDEGKARFYRVFIVE